MSESHIYSFSGNSSDHVSVCPSVCLTGLNIWTCAAKEACGGVVAHAQHNATGMTELYCSVVHAQCNTTNLDRRGRRAREGSEQHACRLKHDRERARQRRQWQGPGARVSERFKSANKKSLRRKRTASKVLLFIPRPFAVLYQSQLCHNSVNSRLIDRFEAVANSQTLAYLCLS